MVMYHENSNSIEMFDPENSGTPRRESIVRSNIHSPLPLDQEPGEYRCKFCGSKLPQNRRGESFTHPQYFQLLQDVYQEEKEDQETFSSFWSKQAGDAMTGTDFFFVFSLL